jgi:hypothetical protein
MLEMCEVHRASRHRIAKEIASFSYNHQGKHFEFKLHLSTGLDGALCNFYFMPASVYDGQILLELIDGYTKLAVGGAGICLQVLRHDRPGHASDKAEEKTHGQMAVDSVVWRTKIEAVNDRVKKHLHLISSFLRPMNGYLLH